MHQGKAKALNGGYKHVFLWQSGDRGESPAVTYKELIERAGPAGERHETTIALALDMRAAARQIRASWGQ